MPELQCELLIVELIHDPCAHGVALRGGELLEQPQSPRARAGQLLYPQDVLIVKCDWRDLQMGACLDFDSSTPGALAELVSGYPEQPG